MVWHFVSERPTVPKPAAFRAAERNETENGTFEIRSIFGRQRPRWTPAGLRRYLMHEGSGAFVEERVPPRAATATSRADPVLIPAVDITTQRLGRRLPPVIAPGPNLSEENEIDVGQSKETPD